MRRHGAAGAHPDAGGTDTHRRHEWWVLAGFVVVSEAAGLLGTPFTDRARGGWYDSLEKPPFNPPSWVFAPVWTTLYLLIGIAAWRVWRTDASGARRRALTAWGVQLALNALWTPLFFGAEHLGWAMFDIAALVLAVAVVLDLFRQRDRLAGLLLTPYLAWVCFAALLNGAFLVMNFG